MKKEEFFKILEKYRKGNATDEEKSFLRAYFNLFEGEANVISVLTSEEKELLKNQIKNQLLDKIGVPVKRTTIMVRRWSVAASIIFLIATGVILYRHQAKDDKVVYEGKKLLINPKGNKAVLMLSNGTHIDLADAAAGQIAKEGNTRIVKATGNRILYQSAKSNDADTALNTIYTARGGQVMIVLPDNTKAYLNAESSLRFPAAFRGNYRNVILTGEAYFEVAHDKTKPFRVIGGGQTVEVLGTHFDIKAYADENTVQTTLLEGRVNVTAGRMHSFLMPGEQAENKDGDLLVRKSVDAEEAIAWRSGLFHFEKAGIRDVLKEFARWYDVEIIYSGPVKERLFSGDLYKNLELGKALELLNYENVHFIISGRKIYVKS